MLKKTQTTTLNNIVHLKCVFTVLQGKPYNKTLQTQNNIPCRQPYRKPSVWGQ